MGQAGGSWILFIFHLHFAMRNTIPGTWEMPEDCPVNENEDPFLTGLRTVCYLSHAIQSLEKEEGIVVSFTLRSPSQASWWCGWKILGWPKSLFEFFHTILQENSNELFGLPNNRNGGRVENTSPAPSCHHHFEGPERSLWSNCFSSLKLLPGFMGKSLKWLQRVPAV